MPRIALWLCPSAARAGLACWVVAMLLLGAYTTGAHSAALPNPGARDQALQNGVLALRVDPARPLVVHALYAACKCSQGIVERLLRRGRDSRFDELVLLVGKLPEQEPVLLARGFRVQRVAARDLGARFHIEAAPMLVVTDARGVVRYAGGYSKLKGGPSADQEILDRAAAGGESRRLPILGCAVSERLKALIDPLGLRD